MQDLDLNFRSIAHDWYLDLSPIAFTPAKYNKVIDTLAKLVQEATRLRFGADYQSVEAEQIGSVLADLNYIQGDAIGLSIKVLSNAWMGIPSSPMRKGDGERLANLFADIANGYFKATTNYILKSQEMMREAQLLTVRTLHANLQRQKDNLSITAERLQTLHDIELGILAAQSAEAIANVAITHILRIIPGYLAIIVAIDPQRNDFVVLASKNTPEITGDFLPLSITTDERLLEMRFRKKLILNNLGILENRPIGLENLYSRNIKSVMTIPLITADSMVGLLSLGAREVNFFTDHHVEIASQIANSVAIALHNRQLLETEQKARRESETLREVASSLSSNLEQEELLDNILVQLENLLPHDGAIIMLNNEIKSEIVAQRGFQNEFITNLNALAQLTPNMQRVIDTKQPVYIPDSELDPEWIKMPGATHVRSWLGAPLIFQEEIIGLLALDKDEPDFFPPSSAGLVLTFANHAAVVIKNAQLFKKVQQNRDMLRESVAARTRELESLYEIAAISSQPLDLSSILNIGLERILSDLNCHSGTIHVLDKDSGTFNLAEFVNLDSFNLDHYRSIKLNNPLLRELIEREKPIIFRNTSNASRPVDWLLPPNDICFIGVPMRARGNIQGIMCLYCEQNHELTTDEIKLAASIADHLGVAIDNANLQAQSEHAAVTEERERLARDLHDSATQSLFSLNLFAAAAREKVLSGQLDNAIKHLDDIGYTANQTHRDMRLLLYQLGTSQILGETLVEVLDHRLHAVEQRSGINVTFHHHQTTDLNSEVAQALYQIANEALNNALKHAGGTSIVVELLEENNDIILIIKDNGNGFHLAPAQNGVGMGLKNMRFRAVNIGGTLSIVSTLGEGTEITARLPKNRNQQPDL
jgi:signal transduction histidine kinase